MMRAFSPTDYAQQADGSVGAQENQHCVQFHMIAECQTVIDDTRDADWNATHNIADWRGLQVVKGMAMVISEGRAERHVHRGQQKLHRNQGDVLEFVLYSEARSRLCHWTQRHDR